MSIKKICMKLLLHRMIADFLTICEKSATMWNYAHGTLDVYGKEAFARFTIIGKCPRRCQLSSETSNSLVSHRRNCIRYTRLRIAKVKLRVKTKSSAYIISNSHLLSETCDIELPQIYLSLPVAGCLVSYENCTE